MKCVHCMLVQLYSVTRAPTYNMYSVISHSYSVFSYSHTLTYSVSFLTRFYIYNLYCSVDFLWVFFQDTLSFWYSEHQAYVLIVRLTRAGRLVAVHACCVYCLAWLMVVTFLLFISLNWQKYSCLDHKLISLDILNFAKTNFCDCQWLI